MPDDPRQEGHTPPPLPAGPAEPAIDYASPAPAETVTPLTEPGVVAGEVPFARVYQQPAPSPAPPAFGAPAGPPALPAAGAVPQPPQAHPYYPPAYPPQPAYPPSPYPGAGYGPVYPPGMSPLAFESRPRIVGALGVASVVIASLGLMASLFTGCSAVGIYNHAKRGALVQKAGGAVSRTPTAPLAVPPDVQAVGLSESDRNVILNALQNRTTTRMSALRLRQVEGLLARHGYEIFDPGPALSVEQVSANIERAGVEHSAQGGTGPHYFQFRQGSVCKLTGVLRVTDDLVTYKPVLGADPIRVSVRPDETVSGDKLAGAAPPVNPGAPPPPVMYTPGGFAGLDISESDAVVAQAQLFARGRMNNAQVQAIQAEFQSPNAARWFAPSSTVSGYTAQVKSTLVNADGSAVVVLTSGRLAVGSTGAIDWATSTPMQVATAQSSTTQPTMGGPPGWGPGPVIVADIPALRTVMGESIASGVLAGLLGLAGILLFKQSRWTRRAYVTWAILKLVTAGVGVWAALKVAKSLDEIDA
ncbi:MAG: hypothetical protein ACAI43_00100, partial [Phycisphaerae bacterium]